MSNRPTAAAAAATAAVAGSMAAAGGGKCGGGNAPARGLGPRVAAQRRRHQVTALGVGVEPQPPLLHHAVRLAVQRARQRAGEALEQRAALATAAAAAAAAQRRLQLRRRRRCPPR